MSKIKDLRNNPDNLVNIVDFVSIMCPKDKESKYVPLFLKFMKETSSFNRYTSEVIDHMVNQYNVPREKLTKFTSFQLVLCYLFYNQMFDSNDLVKFQKFCEYNEKNMIPNNDLTKYKSFSDIRNSVDLAEMKIIEKEMEKSIKTIYRDDEWIILRPLTYLSSKKYGANTKWCTASEDTSDQFFRYSRNGILIYVINVKTGLKVACYKESSENSLNPEFSFWNQTDNRIDSIQSGLPQIILMKILDETLKNPITNNDLAIKMAIIDSNNNDYEKRKELIREATNEEYFRQEETRELVRLGEVRLDTQEMEMPLPQVFEGTEGPSVVINDTRRQFFTNQEPDSYLTQSFEHQMPQTNGG